MNGTLLCNAEVAGLSSAESVCSKQAICCSKHPIASSCLDKFILAMPKLPKAEASRNGSLTSFCWLKKVKVKLFSISLLQT